MNMDLGVQFQSDGIRKPFLEIYIYIEILAHANIPTFYSMYFPTEFPISIRLSSFHQRRGRCRR